MLLATIIPKAVMYIQSLLAFAFAYLISVTLAGAITAWTAKKSGDLTADYAGFLTLDPLTHIDPIGAIILVVFGFGWGREIPINAYAIKKPLRDLKLLLTYYSSTLVHFTILVLSIISMSFVQVYFASQDHIPQLASSFFYAFIRLNVWLAILRFIQASVDLIFIPLRIEDEHMIRMISFASSLGLIVFLGEPMQKLLYKLSALTAFALLRIFY